MNNKNKKYAYLIIISGFLLRLLYVRFINPIDKMIYSDMGNYVYIADSIFKGEWKITHFFQPIGYPFILWIFRSLTSNWLRWLEWFQLILSTATMWIVWKTAKDSFGEKIALVSVAISAVHLPWIAFTGLVLSENTFVFLLSVLCWFSLKLIRELKLTYAVGWAVTFFLAFLIKGTHVFLAPMFILTAYYFFRRSSIKIIIPIVAIVSTGLLAHGLFTHQKVGKFQMSASAGGLNFVEGKCPMKNNADSAGYSWLSPLYAQLGLRTMKRWPVPFTDSGYYMKEGLKCIARSPYVLIQSLEGIPFLFVGNTLWPANQTILFNQMRLYEIFFGCLSIVGILIYFMFLSAEGSLPENVAVWAIPIVSAFVCVYIFKSEIRFRIPFDVWIIPVTVKGWTLLLRAKVT